MEILPSDLGTRRGLNVVSARATVYQHSSARGGRGRYVRNALASGGGKPGRLGLLGRLWTRGLGLSDTEAADLLSRTRYATSGFSIGMIAGSASMLAPTTVILTQNGPHAVAAIFLAMAAGMSSFGALLPRKLIHHWYTGALTEEEMNGLLSDAGVGSNDTLERAYLTLVRDTIRQDNIPAEAAESLRAAIHSLGDALDRLPPMVSPAATDLEALRRDLAAVRAQAAAEPDAVILASLDRRADALERSIASADRSSLLLRRTAALREELAAQTEALRLGLASFYAGGGDIAGLAHLSETVRSVAAEAASVADARAEVDATLGSSASVPSPATATNTTFPATDAAETQPLRVGARP